MCRFLPACASSHAIQVIPSLFQMMSGSGFHVAGSSSFSASQAPIPSVSTASCRSLSEPRCFFVNASSAARMTVGSPLGLAHRLCRIASCASSAFWSFFSSLALSSSYFLSFPASAFFAFRRRSSTSRSMAVTPSMNWSVDSSSICVRGSES